MHALHFPECFANFTLRMLNTSEHKLIAEQLCAMEPWSSLDYSPARLENYLLTPDPCLNCRVINATPGQKNNPSDLIGIFTLRAPWLCGAYLELFAIFPDYQQKGLGKKLLALLEQSVSDASGRNLWIVVSEFNQSARDFYLHQGYQETAQLNDLVKTGFKEILLRKQLSRSIT